MKHPDDGGTEPGEERALIAEGFALLDREARSSNRGGRPTVIDEPMKARISTLMGAGLSLRQAAACLGISHVTISRTVASDPQLKHDVEVARGRATLHPLACVLREAGKNWKAAVWLLEHLKDAGRREKSLLERSEDLATDYAVSALVDDIKPRLLAEARAELARQRGEAPASSPTRRPQRS